MEHRSVGIIRRKLRTPILHNSNIPIFLFYRNISRNFLLQLSISSLVGSRMATI